MLKKRFATTSRLFLCLAMFSLAWLAPARAAKKQPAIPKDHEEYYKKQYKKQNRNMITVIAKGKAAQAAEYFEAYLKNVPEDLESMYGLVVARAQLEQFGEAMRWLEKSVDGGLPFDRYVAGPRELLKPLYARPEFQKFARGFRVRLLHGPVLACMTDGSARFWVRTAEETPVAVRVSESPNVDKNVKTGKAWSKKTDDYTAVVEVDGLEPDTKYFYTLLIDGKPEPLSPAPSFRTFPAGGKSARFSLIFGGGSGYTPWFERMWDTMAEARPLAFLTLGDNVYIDTPDTVATHRYCYYRRQSRPEYKAFAASTPVFAIWDDHDFSVNDCDDGPDPNFPAWKKDSLKVFSENFANPYYGGGKKDPGVWFDLRIGDVDFFFLDSRMYRDFKHTQPRSMLGAVQKQWLKDKLKNSKAAFKVIASSVPWAMAAKPGSKDPWSGFPEEREELFAFLEKNRIDGVVLIAADRHRSDAWKIPRANGYDLYEFMSSKLTNFATHGTRPTALFGYNEKNSYGRLEFDTTLADPEVTYTIVNIDGERIESLRLKLSQLRHK